MTLAILSFGALAGLLVKLTRHDKARYRGGNRQRAAWCHIHKRGGMWFFRVGRLGGSFYIRRTP